MPDEDITIDILAKSWFDTDYKPSTAQGTMANAGIWYQPSRCEFNTIRRNVVIPSEISIIFSLYGLCNHQ
jgi:hypothetical protein